MTSRVGPNAVQEARSNKEKNLQLINSFMISLITRLMVLRDEKHEEGQTLVEYALIIALVSILLVASLTALKGGIAGVFTDIVAAF